MIPFSDTHVEFVFDTYPDEVRSQMLAIRDLVFTTAQSLGLEKVLVESLKWGEPSYSCPSGSALRMDWKKKEPEHYRVFFSCQTVLIETFRTLYPNAFQFEGNRAILIPVKSDPDLVKLAYCIKSLLEIPYKGPRASSLPNSATLSSASVNYLKPKVHTVTIAIGKLFSETPILIKSGATSATPDDLVVGSTLLPMEVKGIDDTEDPEVIDDIASGVDTTSRTADEDSEGYTEDIWIMAPIAGENRVEMTLGASDSMNMTLSADKGFPSPQLLTKSPETVSWSGEGTQSAESVVELSVEGGDKIDLPIKVKNMEWRQLDIVVHPIALSTAGGGPEPPRFLPSQQEIEDYLNRVFKKQANVHCRVTLPPIKSVNWDIADGSQAGTSPHYSSAMVSEYPPDPNSGIAPPTSISAPGDRAFDILPSTRSPEQAAVIAATQDHSEGHIHVYLIGGCSKMRTITQASEEQSPDQFAFVAGGVIGGTHDYGRLTGECWVDANRVSSYGRADKNDVLYTIAHEIGHYVVGDGHPDEEDGVAPLSNTDRSNRLMLSGKSPLRKNPPGIQLVKKEWDEAEERVDKLVRDVPN